MHLYCSNSFCVSCLCSAACPSCSLSSFHFVPTQVLRTFAFQLLCLCCPPSLCLSCASLLVLPCGARVIVLSLCSCGLAVFLGFPPRCACAGPGVSRVVCLPLEWFLSLSSLPPLPREWSYWALAPFVFCFLSLDDETQIWLGNLRLAFLFWFVFCAFGRYDLPWCM